MFKSRSGPQGSPAPRPPQSIEVVRRRARHRLIGASVLVLLGVLGFPLLFDTEPRPLAIDIPIEIPSRTAAAPLSAPVAAAAPASRQLGTSAPQTAPAAPVAVPPQPSVQGGLSPGEEEVAAPRPTPPAAPPPSPVVSAAARPATAPAPGPGERAAAPDNAEAARARALLEGRAVNPPTAASARIVVQVGAFADAARARAVRRQLEDAGLRTYIHVADTPQGQRIRVRLGPYSSRAEAEQAAARVRALGLPATLLAL